MSDPNETDSEPASERTTDRRFPPSTSQFDAVVRDHVWLLPALFVAVTVYATYLLTHPYPAFGAGLYLAMAEQIAAHGYGLPARIPHYTAEGIPFAYPPLGFYVVAVLSDLLGVDPFVFSRILPGLYTVLYLIPFYLFGAELLGSRRQAGLATLIVAASPPVLHWHISAGGFVRSLAVVFAFAGLYTGLKLFRTGDRRWLLASTLLFGLTILTHPLYTAFFAVSYLWLYAYFDRSLPGLARGATVALGGVALAAPWWLQVAAVHGADVFTGAAGTHGGIGMSVTQLLAGAGSFDPSALSSLVPPSVYAIGSVSTLITSALFVVFAAAAVALGRRGRFFLPVWMVVLTVVLGKPRLPFLAGALMVAAVVDIAIDRLGARETPSVGGDERAVGTDGGDSGGIDRERRATLAAFGTVGFAGLALSATYAGRGLRTYGGTTPSLPPFIDDYDVAAMEWVDDNLPADAGFVVVGDAAEWFPYFADRTILVGPWGVEWRGHEPYRNQLYMFRRLSVCESAACFTARLDRFDVSPDYLYVPKGTYTVRSFRERTSPALRRSLIDSPRYHLVYENAGAMVFRVEVPDAEADDGDGS